jgi:hypothetical protein
MRHGNAENARMYRSGDPESRAAMLQGWMECRHGVGSSRLWWRLWLVASIIEDEVLCDDDEVESLYLGFPQDGAVLLELQQLALLLEDLSRLLEHHLEALLTPRCVLLESLDGELLDAVLDLLPASAKRRDFCSLHECGAGC